MHTVEGVLLVDWLGGQSDVVRSITLLGLVSLDVLAFSPVLIDWALR